MTTTASGFPRLAGENAARQNGITMVACDGCGTRFTQDKGRGAPRRYCYECLPRVAEIGKTAYMARWRELNEEYVERYRAARRILGPDGFYSKTCVVCGVAFKTKRKHTQLCGAGRCREEGVDRDLELRAANRRNKNHTRRQRLVTPEAFRLRPAEIKQLLADADECPLCGVALTSEHLSPAQKHLDHVVPLSAGGAHTRANVRVICRSCNLLRPKDGSDVAGPVSLFQVVGA